MRRLTSQQTLFVDAIRAGGTGLEAVAVAYPESGYPTDQLQTLCKSPAVRLSLAAGSLKSSRKSRKIAKNFWIALDAPGERHKAPGRADTFIPPPGTDENGWRGAGFCYYCQTRLPKVDLDGAVLAIVPDYQPGEGPHGLGEGTDYQYCTPDCRMESYDYARHTYEMRHRVWGWLSKSPTGWWRDHYQPYLTDEEAALCLAGKAEPWAAPTTQGRQGRAA